MVALVLDGLVGFPAGLSPTSFHLSPSSFHLSPRLGACGQVPGWLVSHFLSFVSHFFSCVSHFLSFVPPLLFHLSPSSFHCLPGWVLVVGFPAGLSPTSFHLSPTSFHLSPSSFHSSPRLGACGRFPAGLSPTSLHLSPTFSPNSLLLGVLNSFLRCVRPCVTAGVRPFPLAAGRVAFLFICLPGLLAMRHLYSFVSQVCHWWCPLAMQEFGSFVSQVCHCCCPPLFTSPCSISIHLSPRSVAAGVGPFPLVM